MKQTDAGQKYPRTPHLPQSPGWTDDDVRVARVPQPLLTGPVVVTEKMDGENTCFTKHAMHARSLDSTARHPARHYVASLWAQVQGMIPNGIALYGENLYATHAIHYTALPDYFLIFAAVDHDTLVLDWDSTVYLAHGLGLHVVPVLYRGAWDNLRIHQCYTGISKCGGVQEGYVVRTSAAYPFNAHADHAAKWVRDWHVAQDSKHWLQRPLTRNERLHNA